MMKPLEFGILQTLIFVVPRDSSFGEKKYIAKIVVGEVLLPSHHILSCFTTQRFRSTVGQVWVGKSLLPSGNRPYGSGRSLN